jgi:hypothetical protein
MWYSGDNGNSIGFAFSNDGTSWTKYSGNPVFSGGRYTSVLFDGSSYKMWYEGYDYTIRYATSSDGISWTDYGSNPVLVHGSSGSWDDMHVSTPSVIFNGSCYIMSYSGYQGSMLSRKIGLAYSSDGTSWSKDANNPVIDIGSSGTWDDTFVDHSTLLLVGSSLKMWYGGFDGTEVVSSPTYYDRIGLATLEEVSPLLASIDPLSDSISVGNSVLFTSTVGGGSPPYGYQWYLDSSPVSGATSASWTFSPSISGIYYVYLKIADSTSNTTQSETAHITVASPPVGGYSFHIDGHTSASPLTPYLTLIAGIAVAFIINRRKTINGGK